MLKWTNGLTGENQIRNERMRGNVGVVSTVRRTARQRDGCVLKISQGNGKEKRKRKSEKVGRD